MSISKVKTTTIPLPTGYRGLSDFGDGLEYCEVLFAIVQVAVDINDNAEYDCIVSYRGIDGNKLDYVVTPQGQVTDGDTIWSKISALKYNKPELLLPD